VTYKFCCTYTGWRIIPDKRKGKYKAGKNTAILEFKIFRWLMREAVKREYCTGNPAREVVLKKEPRKEFPDLTDQQLQEIWQAIGEEPDETNRIRLQRSFAISLLHGVRLNETNPNPLTDVDLTSDIPTITFRQKGGRTRIKPLHPQLVPLFTRLKKEKAAQTYPMASDAGRLRWSDRWTQFWDRRGFKTKIPNVCFHSLRVTVENVLREASIEQRVREFYLSHEHGKDINARYDRVKVREMLACHAPLNRNWLEV
jgi:integrase